MISICEVSASQKIRKGKLRMDDYRYYRVDYRGTRYEFKFRYTHSRSDGWRAYIVSAPSYAGRSESLSATHRLHGTNGEYYICWNSTIPEEKQMNAVVELWCRATVMYIVNGGESIDAYANKLKAS